MLKQVRVYIKGDVIGVGFRVWAKTQAKIIGVNGWIRNNFDKPQIFGPRGGVETVFQAEEDKLNKILDEVKIGPPVSKVEDTQIIWEDPKEILEGFEIRN